METKRYYKKRVLQVFQNYSKTCEQHFIRRKRKKKTLAKNVFFSAFTLLFTRAQKRMESILYGEMKGYYEIHFLLMFFFSFLSTKNSKMRQQHSIWMNKTLTKTFVLNFFYSQVPKRQNACKALYTGKWNYIIRNMSFNCREKQNNVTKNLYFDCFSY